MNTLPEAHIAGVKMRRPPSLVKENALLHPAPSGQIFLFLDHIDASMVLYCQQYLL